MEIMPGLDVGGLAERLARERMNTPFESFEQLSQLPGASPKTSTQLINIATFKSRYFQVEIDCFDQNTTGGTSFNIIFDRTTKQIVRWEED